MSGFSNLPDYDDPDYSQKMRDLGAPLHKDEVFETVCDHCSGDKDCETCKDNPEVPISDLPRGSLFRRPPS